MLVPTFLTLVVVRLSLHARSSRSRVRLLEGDEKRRENALVHAISKFEFEIEEAVISMMEDDRNAQLARPIDNSVEKDDTNNRVLTVSEAREIHSSSAANSGKGKAVSPVTVSMDPKKWDRPGRGHTDPCVNTPKMVSLDRRPWMKPTSKNRSDTR